MLLGKDSLQGSTVRANDTFIRVLKHKLLVTVLKGGAGIMICLESLKTCVCSNATVSICD